MGNNMNKLILTLVVLIPALANSAVIDFNDSPDDSYFVTPVISDGFSFSDPSEEGSLGTADNLDDSSVNNGTVHLMDWVNNGSLAELRMEAIDGSLFSLSAFDFSSGYLNGSNIANQLVVTGFDALGNAIANALFSSADYSHLAFTTLNLSGGFSGLAYVTFEATGATNRVGYDNFTVNVPEPSSLILLVLGLLSIAISRVKTR